MKTNVDVQAVVRNASGKLLAIQDKQLEVPPSGSMPFTVQFDRLPEMARADVTAVQERDV